MGDGNSRLSRITTIWTTIREAHETDGDDAARARRDLVERYQGAAFRYLLGALRDVDAAEEVFQEFALRVVVGRFSGADAEKGRFRDYLRTISISICLGSERPNQCQLTPDESIPSGTAGRANRDQTSRERMNACKKRCSRHVDAISWTLRN